MTDKTTAYNGSCHCGAVRFRVQVREHRVLDCNCSICRKKGYLHLLVPSTDFTLLSGRASLSTYTFNTKVAQHHFCSVCGVSGFYRPRSHPEGLDVNLRCLDDADLKDFSVIEFDGDQWEENVHKIRH